MENHFETDDQGRLMRCLHCGEENAFKDDKDAVFCIYCGYSLSNQCTNYNQCGVSLPPNAAYCPYCGSESHFLRSGLVNSKRKNYILDEDLPF
ncbi:zinc-ribbon domain-containing protein [Geobacillus thermoleovorans]|uniref:zinc-ribbon domain-containing protein n=1 Tax=Geobacillus thermoleovorans TaxID=33941 RepID=UPI000FE14556|nr:zinc-ribbon domain-containing protein [Geobacillus thermoleovorans]